MMDRNAQTSRSALSHRWKAISRSMEGNPRLQIMAWLIALTVLVDVGMRWMDDLDAQFNERTQLQTTLAQLKAQSKDPQKLSEALQAANNLQALASSRLLEAHSEALAQARLQDWLGDLTRQANVQVLNLNVGNARTPSKSVAASSVQPAKATASQLHGSITEIPVTLVFRFTPSGLIAVLQGLEAGDSLVRVETLSVRRLDRRVEVGIVVPVRIKAGF